MFKDAANVCAQFPAIALRDMLKNLFDLGGKMNAKTVIALGLVHGLLAGCAAPVADFMAHEYEPVCARECLALNSQCIQTVRPYNRDSCNANTRQCLSTCPKR